MSAPENTRRVPAAPEANDDGAAHPDSLPDQRTGIDAVDQHLSGLRRGVYVVSGAPGAGKLAFLLQVVAGGIRSGERTVLITASPPEEVIERAGHWGVELETPWREDRLVLVEYHPDFPRRVLHAAEPADVFAELDSHVDGPAARIAVHPGSMLWDTRVGTAMAGRLITWLRGRGASVWATVTGDLAGEPPTASDWVLQRAAGVFHLERHPAGVHQLTVRQLHPPAQNGGPITLELMPGRGFIAASGRLDRRRMDAPSDGAGRLLVLRLDVSAPADLAGWLRREYEVTEATDAIDAVSALGDSAEFGAVLVLFERAGMEEAIRVCRTLRPLARGAIVLAADEGVRAADRARALEAGADDVLSGDIDVRELESRLRLAAEAPRHRADALAGSDQGGLNGAGGADGDTTAVEPTEAVLPADRFGWLVRERRASDAHDFFTLVAIGCTDAATPERVGTVLLAHVRTEDGDAVGELASGYGVVLQGARARQAEAFLDRVREALEAMTPSGAGIRAEVLNNPADAERIDTLVQD